MEMNWRLPQNYNVLSEEEMLYTSGGESDDAVLYGTVGVIAGIGFGVLIYLCGNDAYKKALQVGSDWAKENRDLESGERTLAKETYFSSYMNRKVVWPALAALAIGVIDCAVFAYLGLKV